LHRPRLSAIIMSSRLPASHPDCRAVLIQIVALQLLAPDAFASSDASIVIEKSTLRIRPATKGRLNLSPLLTHEPPADLARPFPVPATQADPGAATVLVNELHAGGFQDAANGQIVGRCHEVSTSASSARRMVASPKAAFRASSAALHRRRVQELAVPW
jgi:hypothetical protein